MNDLFSLSWLKEREKRFLWVAKTASECERKWRKFKKRKNEVDSQTESTASLRRAWEGVRGGKGHLKEVKRNVL